MEGWIVPPNQKFWVGTVGMSGSPFIQTINTTQTSRVGELKYQMARPNKEKYWVCMARWLSSADQSKKTQLIVAASEMLKQPVKKVQGRQGRRYFLKTYHNFSMRLNVAWYKEAQQQLYHHRIPRKRRKIKKEQCASIYYSYNNLSFILVIVFLLLFLNSSFAARPIISV